MEATASTGPAVITTAHQSKGRAKSDDQKWARPGGQTHYFHGAIIENAGGVWKSFFLRCRLSCLSHCLIDSSARL